MTELQQSTFKETKGDFIFYPGKDPASKKDLKTFIRQKDDIVFIYKSGAHLHWNFTNSYDRDQCFALLLEAYTDRVPSEEALRLNSLSEYIVKVDFAIEEIMITWKNRTRENIYSMLNGKDFEFSGLEFHLFVLDVLIESRVKVFFPNGRIPYPFNPTIIDIEINQNL